MKTPRHTEDSTPSEARKTLAKNAENVMFYHLRGSALRGPQWTSNLTLYMRTYESSEV